MTRPIKNDESLSIELEDEDLLDIDGSDDPTTAFAGKALLSKLRAPQKKQRAQQPPPQQMHVVDDPTVVLRDDVRETIPFPKRFAVKGPSSPPAAANVHASMAPKKSPTISPVPSVRNRNANSSYPPIAINVAPAHRDRQMSFISERPSRAGWIAAAVLGALILVGGSIKVAAPKVAPAANPTPALAAEAPPEAPAEEPKVVTFGDNQGVSIKAKTEAKSDAKSDAKPEAKKSVVAAPHFVAPKSAAKPAVSSKAADNSLAVTKDEKKDDKIPSTSHDATASSNMSKADQKKLKSIEQDLADLQLKAAAR